MSVAGDGRYFVAMPDVTVLCVCSAARNVDGDDKWWEREMWLSFLLVSIIMGLPSSSSRWSSNFLLFPLFLLFLLSAKNEDTSHPFFTHFMITEASYVQT